MPDPIRNAAVPSANACYPEDNVCVPSGRDAATPPTATASANVPPPAPPPPPTPAVTALVERFSTSGGGSTPGTPGQRVLVCHRIADLPFNSQLKLQHYFLATSTHAAGAGHCGDGVPGHGHVDLPFSQTCINDHTSEVTTPGVSCEPVAADEACVDRALLQLGTHLGPWVPLFNDCHTFVARVIADCALSTVAAAEGASGLDEPGRNVGF